ncbi:MAG: response regulator transcription factor [Calditrichia bacterium]|nr:response regulator transcription factor [Calditrichia bacterium]
MPENDYAGSRILLVEDEDSLAIGLEYNLSEEGYSVIIAADGKQALEHIDSKQFDLVILDIMLPYLDGFEVAQKIREQFPQMPILMLTARTAAKDRIRGLELGADDYLTKPFHLQELLLRIRGMLKRKRWYQSATTDSPLYQFGENEVNFENLTCRAGKKDMKLTAREAMFLRYLIDNRGRVISRKEILENVWNIDSEVETRTIDNFIVRLRKFFEPNPSKPLYIKSVRGIGYMFEV